MDLWKDHTKLGYRLQAVFMHRGKYFLGQVDSRCAVPATSAYQLHMSLLLSALRDAGELRPSAMIGLQ